MLWRPAAARVAGQGAGLLTYRKDGAPGEIRTPDLLVRSQTLYPTELRALLVLLYGNKILAWGEIDQRGLDVAQEFGNIQAETCGEHF